MKKDNEEMKTLGILILLNPKKYFLTTELPINPKKTNKTFNKSLLNMKAKRKNKLSLGTIK